MVSHSAGQTASGLSQYFAALQLPSSNSHKGQNGRLLVIGGSQLFHASIFWSASVASHFVDIVHFSSPANENNELVRFQLKRGFWEGIVVDWSDIDAYLAEDDCILIGPGMERTAETAQITNDLLTRYPAKKWVVDGGALQQVDPQLLTKTMIITPHVGELARLAGLAGHPNLIELLRHAHIQQLLTRGITVLAKGPQDYICHDSEQVISVGGNAGMTKGGTGDVLAGLVAALYCTNDSMVAAVAASAVNKRASEQLWQQQGPFFNASNLVEVVPKVLWDLMSNLADTPGS